MAAATTPRGSSEPSECSEWLCRSKVGGSALKRREASGCAVHTRHSTRHYAHWLTRAVVLPPQPTDPELPDLHPRAGGRDAADRHLKRPADHAASPEHTPPEPVAQRR